MNNDIDLNLIARDYNGTYMIRAILIMLLLVAATAVMHQLNIRGYQAWNLVPMIFGFIYLLAVGTSPAALGISAVAGTIVKTANFNNPFSGIADGASFWVTVALPATMLAFCGVAGLLATFPFAGNPVGFWYIAGFGLVAALATIVWRKGGETLYKLIKGYSVLIMVLAAMNSFLPVNETIDKLADNRGAALTLFEASSKSSDACGGDPNYSHLPAEARNCETVTLTTTSNYPVSRRDPARPNQRRCLRWDGDLVATPGPGVHDFYLNAKSGTTSSIVWTISVGIDGCS